MSKRKFTNRTPIARTMAAIALMLAVAGCEGGAGFSEAYDPSMPHERYPIEVAKGKVNAEFQSAHGTLSAAQEQSVRRFAQQAQSNAASVIYVRRPSGGGRSKAVASEIAAVLTYEGIDEANIVQTTYPAGSRSPVLVSYVRRYAVTKECGDWSESLTATNANDVYPNFGCAHQHNIAAVVANPEDFETPRAQTPSDPMRRNKLFKDYQDAKPTNTQADQAQQIAISTVAQ